MPLGEELEYGEMQEPQSTMSKAELRKTHKPIMEKRRRARINQCLNEIKSLILEAMNKDPSRHAKLEKADILEMAVRHLQDVQRRRLARAVAADPAVLRRFRSGFSECAGEIDRYMGRLAAAEGGEALRAGLGAHLRHCIGGIERAARLAHDPDPASAAAAGLRLLPDNAPGDLNNNPKVQLQLPTQSVRLIPGRLATSELALLLPGAAPAPAALGGHPDLLNNNPASGGGGGPRPSAFAAVLPPARPLSPPPSPPRAAPAAPPSPPRRAFQPLQCPQGGAESPKGFRPVQPQGRARPADPQEALVSSTSAATSAAAVQTELKSMRFPIRPAALDRERRPQPQPQPQPPRTPSPRRLAEPLCIITNQSERYRQAQARLDAAGFAENAPRPGTKRKLQEYQGLLAVVPQPQLQTAAPPLTSPPPPQKARPACPWPADDQRPTGGEPRGPDPGAAASRTPLDRRAATGEGAADTASDMWRPW